MSILLSECLSVAEAKLSEPNGSQIKAFLEDVPCKILPSFFSLLLLFLPRVKMQYGCVVPPAGE